MLDGVLTAVLQAEGLAIGDTLHVVFSIRQRPGALPLRAENLYALPLRLPGPPPARARVLACRYTDPVAGHGIARRACARAADGTGQRVAARRHRGRRDAAAGHGAGCRFMIPSTLQVSGFRDWAEIGSQLTPHYTRAATLAPDSPLRAKIAEIAAASTDPRARAMAALRLVEDEVRYFAVTIGDGNYLPATADETWNRRYGDCKGKTVLLLALLRGLGIEAESLSWCTARWATHCRKGCHSLASSIM